jgi:hypothetical protein
MHYSRSTDIDILQTNVANKKLFKVKLNTEAGCAYWTISTFTGNSDCID